MCAPIRNLCRISGNRILAAGTIELSDNALAERSVQSGGFND